MILILLIIIGATTSTIMYLLYTIIKDRSSIFSPDHLPKFQTSAKLYFDEQTDLPCRRCMTEVKSSLLRLRKRYSIIKDGKGILRIKRLAFVYSCQTCDYRSLDIPNLIE